MEKNNQDKIKYEEFYRAYLTKIVPKLESVERFRLNELKKYSKACRTKPLLTCLFFIPFIIFALMFLSPFLNTRVSVFLSFLLFLLYALSLIVVCVFHYSAQKTIMECEANYKNLLKKKLLPELLPSFGNIEHIVKNIESSEESSEECEKFLYEYYFPKLIDIVKNKQDMVNKFAHLNNKLMEKLPPETIIMLKENAELEESGLFKNCTDRTTDDEFIGEYKNVKYIISEEKLCYTEKNHAYTFQGVIFKFKLNKNIKDKVIVTTKNQNLSTFTNYLLIALFLSPFFIIGFGGIIYGESLGSRLMGIFVLALIIYMFNKFNKINSLYKLTHPPLEKINLEDPNFIKRFDVKSTNQVEARCLVTPGFMLRFYNLKTVFGAKNVRCSFFKDNLIIAIETKKDLFELGDIKTSVKNEATFNQFYKELKTVFNLIDYLKIDGNNQ